MNIFGGKWKKIFRNAPKKSSKNFGKNSLISINNCMGPLIYFLVIRPLRVGHTVLSCCSVSHSIYSDVFSSETTINMTLDDEVSCSANTSQSCSHRWKWFSGDDVTSESDNQILKPKKVGRHRCEAICSFGKRSCTVNVMYAEVYTTELQPIHVYSNAGTCRSNSQVITINVSVLI